MRNRLFHQFLPLAILVAAALSGWRPGTTRGGAFYSIKEPDNRSIRSVNQEQEREETGIVLGKTVDENNVPVHMIDVTLVPVGSSAANESNEALKEWTKSDGTYKFSGLKPGDYVLAVGAWGAPTGERPFVTSYYPGTDRRELAETIRVQDKLQTEVPTLRLRRLLTASIKIHVKWKDGTGVERSNLLFHNPSFPDQGVIGDTAPQITSGEGEFVVPLGFEYYARAVVQCDAGTKIDARESRPVQQIRIDSNHIPQELTFVIPSQPCKLWTPR